MSDYQLVYRSHAAEYDALVEAEDVDHNLSPAIAAISARPHSILEVGAGTGRLSRLLAPHSKRFVGIEKEPAMLDRARAHLGSMEIEGLVELHVADARSLPVEDAFADLAIAGWVLGHFRSWYAADWKTQIGAAIGEMERALRAHGALVILETLGTGSDEPAAPNAELAEYYAWLESDHGLQRAAIRTDYRFPDVETAARITGFFFGKAFGERVRCEVAAGRWTERDATTGDDLRVRIPECTGLWWRRRAAA